MVGQQIAQTATLFYHVNQFSLMLQTRGYSYESEDLSAINVMLNSNDVSEYLKIAPNGLEVSLLSVQVICFVV